MVNFTFIFKKLGKIILDQVVNKYSLRKYLISFLVLNKDLLLKSKRLTTVGLKAINLKLCKEERA